MGHQPSPGDTHGREVTESPTLASPASDDLGDDSLPGVPGSDDGASLPSIATMPVPWEKTVAPPIGAGVRLRPLNDDDRTTARASAYLDGGPESDARPPTRGPNDKRTRSTNRELSRDALSLPTLPDATGETPTSAELSQASRDEAQTVAVTMLRSAPGDLALDDRPTDDATRAIPQLSMTADAPPRYARAPRARAWGGQDKGTAALDRRMLRTHELLTPIATPRCYV